MSPSKNKSPHDLPQRSDTWYLAVRQLRAWVTSPDENPQRPYLLLVVNLLDGMLQTATTFLEEPTFDDITNTLFEAMTTQHPGSDFKPHRPKHIHLEDENLVAPLSQALSDLSISVSHHPQKDMLDAILASFEEYLDGEKPQIPGLLSQENVPPELVADLFEAAAEYFRAEPWIHLTNLQPLAIRVEPDTEPMFVVAMGNAGVEYGLAVYRNWDDFLRLYQGYDDFLEIIPEKGAFSITFDDIALVPFDDIEAIQKYSWEVADEDAYPIPILFLPEEALRPDRSKLLWFEAAMRAVPQFIPKFLKSDEQGDYVATKATFEVQSHVGETKVEIEYPAGEIPKEMLPVTMMEWDDLDETEGEFEKPSNFDRRAMEGMLSQFGSTYDDPQLNDAQEIMYQAWDENNPAKRISLAHKAISISPLCADAYVLLAEEQADTRKRALDLYKMGLKAGEEALGEEFFTENEGFFWGMLETRPYMRAREGVANILWDMGKFSEAIAHYQEMLKLNPNDNQGVRISLLNILLHLDRGDAVDELLADYEDSWTSEWRYTMALRTFILEGNSDLAQDDLHEALEQNPYVTDYLIGNKRIPNRLPDMISLGMESEAASYAALNLNYWKRTTGAINWLRQQTGQSESDAKKESKPKKKAKRGRRSKKS